MTFHELTVLHRVVRELDMNVIVLKVNGKDKFYIGQVSLPSKPDSVLRVTGYDGSTLFSEANVQSSTEELSRMALGLMEKLGSITMTFHENQDWVLYSRG